MLFLGCDPDMHTLALATVHENMTVFCIQVLSIKGNVKESDAVLAMVHTLTWGLTMREEIVAAAVESQELYISGPSKTKNPRNILHLAQVAGAACSRISTRYHSPMTYFPVPSVWKGSRDKLAHHKHILARAKVPIEAIGQMGGKEPYCTIDTAKFPIAGAENINPSDWKHVIDAIGLAQYAAERYLHETAKAKALASARSALD